MALFKDISSRGKDLLKRSFSEQSEGAATDASCVDADQTAIAESPDNAKKAVLFNPIGISSLDSSVLKAGITAAGKVADVAASTLTSVVSSAKDVVNHTSDNITKSADSVMDHNYQFSLKFKNVLEVELKPADTPAPVKQPQIPQKTEEPDTEE